MKSVKMIFPCNVDWKSMSETEGGKYCAACKKLVKDYTASTPDNSGSEVFCGRFSGDQLSYHVSAYEVKNFRSLSLSLLTLLGATMPDQEALAQAPYAVSSDSATKEIVKGKFSNLHFPLRMEGAIRDKLSKEVIANADVRMLQGNVVIYATRTDSSGKFSFVLLEKDIKDPFFDLSVSYSGTSRSNLADTLWRMPLSDTLSDTPVFAIDFTIKPVTVSLTAQPLTETFHPEPLIYTMGTALYLWQPPVFNPGQITGTYTFQSAMSESPVIETYTVAEEKRAIDTTSEPKTVPGKFSSKKKQDIKTEGPLSRIWFLIATAFVALFFGISRARKNK